jgi:GNAT superfamily N-acetyltransferase
MIRSVEPGDRAAWTHLWKAYLAFYETALPEEVYASTWSRLLDPSEPTWGALALQDGVPVGLVHWIFHRSNWTIADACYLQDLFVAPEGRGRGLGSALIDHVAAEASVKGSARVHWLTHESNSTARALYDKVSQRSGFIQYRRNLPAS